MNATVEMVTPEAVAPLSVDEPRRVSETFRESLYVYTRKIRPQWQLAGIVGVSPEHFSRLVNGRIPLRHADEDRIVRAGELMGLAAEDCFE